MVMIPAGRVQLLDPHVGHRAGAHLLLRLRQVHKVKCWYNSTVQYSTVQYSTVQYCTVQGPVQDRPGGGQPRGGGDLPEVSPQEQ